MAQAGQSVAIGCGIVAVVAAVAVVFWKALPTQLSPAQQKLIQEQIAALVNKREKETLQKDCLTDFAKCFGSEGCKDASNITERYLRAGGEPKKLLHLQQVCEQNKKKSA